MVEQIGWDLNYVQLKAKEFETWDIIILTGMKDNIYSVHTCLKASSHLHTPGATPCRHNVVVGGVSSEFLREGDDGHLTQGGGSVPVVQVGVGLVHTILNGAGVSWLNGCALQKGT